MDQICKVCGKPGHSTGACQEDNTTITNSIFEQLEKTIDSETIDKQEIERLIKLGIDIDIIPLVYKTNLLEYIQTDESCCGHIGPHKRHMEIPGTEADPGYSYLSEGSNLLFTVKVGDESNEFFKKIEKLISTTARASLEKSTAKESQGNLKEEEEQYEIRLDNTDILPADRLSFGDTHPDKNMIDIIKSHQIPEDIAKKRIKKIQEFWQKFETIVDQLLKITQ